MYKLEGRVKKFTDELKKRGGYASKKWEEQTGEKMMSTLEMCG